LSHCLRKAERLSQRQKPRLWSHGQRIKMISLFFALLITLSQSTAYIPYVHDPDSLFLITTQLSEDFTGDLDHDFEETTSYRVVITCMQEDGTPDESDIISIRVNSQLPEGEEQVNSES
jgi:hypothetical protein